MNSGSLYCTSYFFFIKWQKKGCCSYYYYVTLFVLNDFNECLCLPELSILFPEFFFLRADWGLTDGREGRCGEIAGDGSSLATLLWSGVQGTAGLKDGTLSELVPKNPIFCNASLVLWITSSFTFQMVVSFTLLLLKSLAQDFLRVLTQSCR